ncbi:hypothetical protein J2S43_007861 [Catenuloplanes nepalensis]|uniref:Uncharacterized protein n=1 Tax=Catenuloplanes nepalensis TaxID=587533 RepID=A0ABT9N6M8_9ACTN|nr:hypothetical protein [Catenuloplanes nepalensis]MDP9799349.1 hypothetical protein [Catenuloplanes nepalensis]
MPFPYATSEQLRAHLGVLPADADQLLVRASRDVRHATRCAVYAVDENGEATDLAVVVALRDAVLEQIAAGRASGDKTGLGASTPSSFSIGRLSVSAPTGTTAAAGVKVGALWMQAWLVLDDAGLLGQPQS